MMRKLTKQREISLKHMPSIILLTVVLLAASVNVFADDGDVKWYKTYDFNSENISIGMSVRAAAAAGFIIGCYHRTSDNENKILTIKTDNNGDTLWTKNYDWDYDSNYLIETHGIQKVSDGGYIIGGTRTWQQTEEFGDAEVLLIRTDSNGDTLWTRSYGRENPGDCFPAYHCFTVNETSDGGFIIGGYMTKESSEGSLGNYDGLVIKTDANGDSLWARTFGEDMDSIAYVFYNTLETADGGFIVGGYRQWLDLVGEEPWYRQPYLLKLSADGDSLWSYAYRESSIPYVWGSIYNFAVTSDGGYAYCGSIFDYVTCNTNLMIGKTDSVGNVLWDHEFNDGGENDSIAFTNEGTSIVQTEDNGFLIVGTMSYADFDLITYKYPLALRLDASGDCIWFNNYFDDIGYAGLRSVCITDNSNFVVTGGTYIPGDGYQDALLVKFDLAMVGIDDNPVNNLPDEFALMQNYPNPFNMSTVISYQLTNDVVVKLDVYDLLGRKIETLVNEKQSAGVHQVSWHADDIASGMYFYKLQAGDHTQSMKMSLVK